MHKVPEIARQVLDVMLTRPFRVTKFPPQDEYQEMLSRVGYWVARGRPIRIMIGYAPMKNLNTCAVSRADWSEFFALCHLCAWHNKVVDAYPPGLRIKIVFDDSTIAMANRPDRRHMDSYIESVGKLVKAMNYDSFIVGTMRQSAFAWLFNFGLYQWAEWRVCRWERQPENRRTMEKMELFARRNVRLPSNIEETQRDAYYADASHRYRVYWEALQLSGFSRLGNKLIAMYLDGNQHHIRQMAAFHLTTLGKGQVTQPWQGVGALQDNSHGKLIPVVLTSERRTRFEVTRVGGLNFLPTPGFDSIEVCWEPTPQHSGAEPVVRTSHKNSAS